MAPETAPDPVLAKDVPRPLSFAVAGEERVMPEPSSGCQPNANPAGHRICGSRRTL